MSIILLGSHLEKPNICSVMSLLCKCLMSHFTWCIKKTTTWVLFLFEPETTTVSINHSDHLSWLQMGFDNSQIKITLKWGLRIIKTIQKDGHLSWKRRHNCVLNPSNTCPLWIDQYLSGHVYSGRFIWVKHQSHFLLPYFFDSKCFLMPIVTVGHIIWNV